MAVGNVFKLWTMSRITRQIQPTPSVAALLTARLICGVMHKKVTQLLARALSGLLRANFNGMTRLPLLRGFGRSMYASVLCGEASGLYFKKRYEKAFAAYKTFLRSAEGLEDDPAVGFCIEEAYKALGNMYENGLGVERDEKNRVRERLFLILVDVVL